MPSVVGVKFDNNPKVYYFSPKDLEPEVGQKVVVETSRGLDYGTITLAKSEVSGDKIVGKLMPVVRLATKEDDEKYIKLTEKSKAAYPGIAEKIKASGLEMKLVSAEYTFDGSKLIVYFTADGRVDFRNLVRELASTFHTRIELKQIGARDECRMLGGIAPCGRACCCSDHISEYSKVSIKMAKNQNLSLNPGKISGLCGRLMCCLAYENEYYCEVCKLMPKVGATVTLTSGKTGTVTATNPLRKTVKIKVEDADKDSFTISDYELSEIKFKPKQGKPEPEKQDDNDDTDDLSSLKEDTY